MKVVTLQPIGHIRQVGNVSMITHNAGSPSYFLNFNRLPYQWQALQKQGGKENYTHEDTINDWKVSLDSGGRVEAAMSSYRLAPDERCAGARTRTSRVMFTPRGDGSWLVASVIEMRDGLVTQSGIDTSTILNSTYIGGWVPVPGGGWEYTQADIDNLGIRVHQVTSSEVHVFWADIQLDIRSRPSVSIVAPGSVVDPEFDVVWATSVATGDPQKKWQVKVFDAGDFASAGNNPDTAPALFNSGTNVGGHTSTRVNKFMGFGRELVVAVRSAVDFRGSDWWSPWAVRTVTTNTQPRISAITPYGIVNVARPTITWTIVGNAHPIDRVEIQLVQLPDNLTAWPSTFRLGDGTIDPVWQTTIVRPTTNSVVPDVYLNNDKQYRLYMRFTQSGYVWTAPWVYNTLLVDYNEPAVPHIIVTPDIDKARVRIDVYPNPTPADAVEEAFSVERMVDGVWEPLRGGEHITRPGNGHAHAVTVYDGEAPFCEPVRYRAHSLNNDPGVWVTSLPSIVAATKLDIHVLWLKDPLDSERALHFPVQDQWLQRTSHRERSAQRAMGRRLPRVVSGTAQGEQFTVNFLVMGRGKDEQLEELLDTPHALLLQSPGKCWYVSVSGDITISDHLWDELRGVDPVWIYSVPFIETERP